METVCLMVFFCLANDENHCVRINEIKSYNQALDDAEESIKECLKSVYGNMTDDDIFTIVVLRSLRK